MVKTWAEKRISQFYGVTAYLDEAELCDEVIFLNEGEILFLETPNILKDSMKDSI